MTVREYEVLQALMTRQGNKDIAELLHISPRTVEKHVASLLMKTSQPYRDALAEFVAALQRPVVGAVRLRGQLN